MEMKKKVKSNGKLNQMHFSLSKSHSEIPMSLDIGFYNSKILIKIKLVRGQYLIFEFA